MHFISGITRKAIELFNEFHSSRPENERPKADPKSAAGVRLRDLPIIEDYFNLSIYVYELTERRPTEEEVPNSDESDCETPISSQTDTIALLRRRSASETGNILYLHLFQEHFSFISNIKTLTRTFKCDRCYTLWKSPYKLRRHIASCSASSKIIHPTRIHHPPKNIFEELAEEGLEVEKDKQFYPFRLCWDIEVYFDNSNLPPKSAKLALTAQHKLASISIATNVPGIESPVCFIAESDADESALMKTAMSHMMQASKAAYQIMVDRHEAELTVVEMLIADSIHNEERALESMCAGDKDDARIKHLKMRYAREGNSRLKRLHERYFAWIANLPCFGFNSSRYDQSVVKEQLIKYMMNSGDGVKVAIKRGTSYKCLSCNGLMFLDVCNYLPPHTDYSSYLKSYQVKETKFFFPYEAFTSLDFLEQTSLPPHSAFYSSIKNSNITEEEYGLCLETWKRENFRNMRDYLIYYNNLDTTGMLAALDVQMRYYRSIDLCMSKDGISLPGLAAKYLYKTAPEGVFFPLFKGKPELYSKLRAHIRGGLSMIMTRYSEAGKTKIREEEFGSEAKYCQSVIGVDVSGMYLYCMAQEQCVGKYTLES